MTFTEQIITIAIIALATMLTRFLPFALFPAGKPTLDRMRDKSGSDIYRTKAGFTYPIQKFRDGSYKVKSGELLRVCMTSDFFLEEADIWRDEAWEIMRQRPDVKFFFTDEAPASCYGLPSQKLGRWLGQHYV